MSFFSPQHETKKLSQFCQSTVSPFDEPHWPIYRYVWEVNFSKKVKYVSLKLMPLYFHLYFGDHPSFKCLCRFQFRISYSVHLTVSSLKFSSQVCFLSFSSSFWLNSTGFRVFQAAIGLLVGNESNSWFL